jgi:hypothetical protein
MCVILSYTGTTDAQEQLDVLTDLIICFVEFIVIIWRRREKCEEHGVPTTVWTLCCYSGNWVIFETPCCNIGS